MCAHSLSETLRCPGKPQPGSVSSSASRCGPCVRALVRAALLLTECLILRISNQGQARFVLFNSSQKREVVLLMGHGL